MEYKYVYAVLLLLVYEEILFNSFGVALAIWSFTKQVYTIDYIEDAYRDLFIILVLQMTERSFNRALECFPTIYRRVMLIVTTMQVASNLVVFTG